MKILGTQLDLAHYSQVSPLVLLQAVFHSSLIFPHPLLCHPLSLFNITLKQLFLCYSDSRVCNSQVFIIVTT